MTDLELAREKSLEGFKAFCRLFDMPEPTPQQYELVEKALSFPKEKLEKAFETTPPATNGDRLFIRYVKSLTPTTGEPT